MPGSLSLHPHILTEDQQAGFKASGKNETGAGLEQRCATGAKALLRSNTFVSIGLFLRVVWYFTKWKSPVSHQSCVTPSPLSHLVLCHTWSCHTWSCVTVLCHIQSCHIWSCVTPTPLSHTVLSYLFLCHTWSCVTPGPVSHPVLCHTQSCVSLSPTSMLWEVLLPSSVCILILLQPS